MFLPKKWPMEPRHCCCHLKCVYSLGIKTLHLYDDKNILVIITKTFFPNCYPRPSGNYTDIFSTADHQRATNRFYLHFWEPLCPGYRGSTFNGGPKQINDCVHRWLGQPGLVKCEIKVWTFISVS